ncbi:hypothetical protein ACVW0P_000421 [Mucilaginibacter sp. UYNi724]
MEIRPVSNKISVMMDLFYNIAFKTISRLNVSINNQSNTIYQLY